MEIRELKLNDYELNYFELLSQLSQVTKPSKKEFEYYFNKIISNNNHKIFVIEENGVIVANVTIILEQKFIRGCKCICHIEDVVVHKDYRGKGIASKLLDFVKGYAQQNNCYKIILNCSQDYKKFYEKNGFIEKNIQMEMRFNNL
jgi:glucosamine-phosphate N-acetyltransferase